MKTVALIGGVVLALVIAVLLLAGVLFLTGEATVSWNRHHYGIAARLDLSEDYGFGMLALLIDCAVAMAALPFTFFAGWHLSGRVQNAWASNQAAGCI